MLENLYLKMIVNHLLTECVDIFIHSFLPKFFFFLKEHALNISNRYHIDREVNRTDIV